MYFNLHFASYTADYTRKLCNQPILKCILRFRNFIFFNGETGVNSVCGMTSGGTLPYERFTKKNEKNRK